MGMFDSFYDAEGGEWQTKALGRVLSRWDIGDPVQVPFDCQMEALGEVDGEFVYGLATIREGVLRQVPAARDHTLPLIPYGGLGATYATTDDENRRDSA